MKDLWKEKNKGPGRKAGFTLLEVMVAAAILVACLVPLLGAVIQGLRSASNARDIVLASQLARNKMTQIELERFPEFEGKDSGDFGSDYPGFSWYTDMFKSPELELLEDQIPGLETMEVHLYITWGAGIAKKELEVSTLLAE
jgi:type II secretion system protein I